ncbi:hypothetical protein ABKV19_016194 [Rosa sericea]
MREANLKIIEQVLKAVNVLNSKWRKPDELVYIATYDTLFSQISKPQCNTLKIDDNMAFSGYRNNTRENVKTKIVFRPNVSMALFFQYNTALGATLPGFGRYQLLSISLSRISWKM